MDNRTAVAIAEGSTAPNSQEHHVQAWQRLVDTGLVWNLQSRYGRTAADMIARGVVRDTHNVIGCNPHA